jgi:hypothetical protein
MRKRNYRHLVVYIAVLLSFGASTAGAQSVAGKWYGIGNPDIQGSSNSYLCELIITQKGSTVTGYFNTKACTYFISLELEYRYRGGLHYDRCIQAEGSKDRIYTIRHVYERCIA